MRLVKNNSHAVMVARKKSSGRRGVLVANLNFGTGRHGECPDCNPVHLAYVALVLVELAFFAHYHAVVGGVERDHVERFSGGDAEAAPLPDSEVMQAVVAAEETAVSGDNFTG